MAITVVSKAEINKTNSPAKADKPNTESSSAKKGCPQEDSPKTTKNNIIKIKKQYFTSDGSTVLNGIDKEGKVYYHIEGENLDQVNNLFLDFSQDDINFKYQNKLVTDKDCIMIDNPSNNIKIEFQAEFIIK